MRTFFAYELGEGDNVNVWMKIFNILYIIKMVWKTKKIYVNSTSLQYLLPKSGKL